MRKPVVNLADVPLRPRPAELAPTGEAAERYDARIGFVGEAVGARKLGYNVTVVPPGRRAFPSHNHHVNEEMFLVLEGRGEVHIGESRHPIRPHDVIACPPGGAETAHQIVNTGDEDLKFLAVSTRLSPEVVEYPRSGKFGVLAEFVHEPGAAPRTFRFIGREEQAIDYWEGE